MPRIITSNKAQPGTLDPIGNEGRLAWLRHGINTFNLAQLHPIPLPTGTQGLRRRPCWVTYNAGARSRFFGAGAWTANVLIDENLRCLREGIPAFTDPPTVTAAAGPGVTGTSVCYLRPLDYLGQRKGRLSAPATVTLANQQRSWSTLPTTHPDPSVSYLQGLVEHDGGLPRVAWTRQLGATAVVEGVATGALGEAHPADYVAIPICAFHVIYHDRKVAAGHSLLPEVVFLSDELELERHSGLVLLSEGETVKGLWVQNDTLYYGSGFNIYRASGYNITDFTREVDKRGLGILGHHGITQAFKRTIIPTTEGFQLHDGNYHFICDDRQKEFVAQAKLFRSDYEQAQGIYDPESNVYLFGPVRHSEITNELGNPMWVKWVCDGERLFPELEGERFGAHWANDKRYRKDMTSVVFTLPGGGAPQLATGSEDGNLRLENVDTNLDDDGDLYGKETIIEPGTFMPHPGGLQTDGHTWHKALNYMECERDTPNAWKAEFRAGGEHCRKRAAADYDDETDGGFLEEGGNISEAETITPHVLEGVAGKAMSMKIILQNGSGQTDRWRGCHVTYGPGVTARGITVPEDETLRAKR